MLPQGAVLYGGLMCLQMETVSCLTLNSLLKNHGLEDITFLYNLPLIILTMVVQNRQNPFKVEYFFLNLVGFKDLFPFNSTFYNQVTFVEMLLYN